MDISERHFYRCLCIMEKGFDAIFLNIFHTIATRRTIGYYIFSLVYVLVLLGYGYTFVNYEGTIAIMAMTFAMGFAQVVYSVASSYSSVISS